MFLDDANIPKDPKPFIWKPYCGQQVAILFDEDWVRADVLAVGPDKRKCLVQLRNGAQRTVFFDLKTWELIPQEHSSQSSLQSGTAESQTTQNISSGSSFRPPSGEQAPQTPSPTPSKATPIRKLVNILSHLKIPIFVSNEDRDSWPNPLYVGATRAIEHLSRKETFTISEEGITKEISPPGDANAILLSSIPKDVFQFHAIMISISHLENQL